MLRDVYGMSYDEIAQLVGAPLGTVKAQIHHGRKLARPLLRGRASDAPPRSRRSSLAAAWRLLALVAARRARRAPRRPSDAPSRPPRLPARPTAPPDPDDPAYDAARERAASRTRVYPDVGDPGVDALHYDLDLTWAPDDRAR